MTTVDITNPASRRLLARVAFHVINTQTAFPGDITRRFTNSRSRTEAVLTTLQVLEVLAPPEAGALAWTVLIRAERANEIYTKICAGPDAPEEAAPEPNPVWAWCAVCGAELRAGDPLCCAGGDATRCNAPGCDGDHCAEITVDLQEVDR